jgi:hypothetical protein
MSSLPNLPKRILQSLIKIEKKIVTYPIDEKLKRWKDKYQDIKENRELLVVDKFGNRYYQYYSHHGLPTRRVVINNMKGFNKWDDDPFMMSWLQRRRDVPLTQEELEKMYIENEEFQRKGLEWDKKEQAMIDTWKKKQQEAIQSERKETKALGEGENFSPGVWDRQIGKKFNTQNALVEVKEEKALIEGASTIPGKYLIEFKEEDEKWMQKKELEMYKPFKEILDKVDWKDYTLEIMVEKSNKELAEKRLKLKEKKKELTNIGKRMIEKKAANNNYSGFRERFKDVFEENDF